MAPKADLNFATIEELSSVPTLSEGPGATFQGYGNGQQAYVEENQFLYILHPSIAAVDGSAVLATRDDPRRRWKQISGGAANGQYTPQAFKIPQANAAGKLSGDWLQNLNPAEYFCSPDGDEANSGTNPYAAKKYFQSCYELASADPANLGGTIFMADDTDWNAEGSGFKVSDYNDGIQLVDAHAFNSIPLLVIGQGKSTFQLAQSPVARVNGGGVRNGVRGDPGLWIDRALIYPMRWVNIYPTATECPIRLAVEMAWYENGSPKFNNVVSADRAAGQTTFVLEDFTLPIASIARVSGVVTITFVHPVRMVAPWSIGDSINVASSSGSFASGTFTITGGTSTTFTYAQAGGDASAGAVGTFGSILMRDDDTLVLHSTNNEWPSTVYKAVSADVATSTVVCTDPYGSSPGRSATVNDVDIGGYCPEDRQDFWVAYHQFSNVVANCYSGEAQDLTTLTNNTVSPGPAIDCGGLMFYNDFQGLYGTGYNFEPPDHSLAKSCLDPQRQAYMLIDCGGGGGAEMKVQRASVTAGGIRLVSNGVGNYSLIASDFVQEGVTGSGGAVVTDNPTVEVIGGGVSVKTNLKFVTLVDSTALYAIEIDGGPRTNNVVESCGPVFGPAEVFGQNVADAVSSTTMITRNQIGFEGPSGLVVGQTDGPQNRFGPVQPLGLQWDGVNTISPSNFITRPSGWTTGGITMSGPVAGPDGLLTATRAVNAAALQAVEFINRSFAPPEAGDGWCFAVKVRGNQGIGLDTGVDPMITFELTQGVNAILSLRANPIRKGDGEWQILRMFGVVSGLTSGNQALVLGIPLQTGTGIDIDSPTLIYLPGSLGLSATQVAEIGAYLDPIPNSAPFGITSTKPGQRFLTNELNLWVPSADARYDHVVGGSGRVEYHTIAPINLLTTGVKTPVIVPVYVDAVTGAARTFIPTGVRVRTRTLTGTIGTGATIRVGNDGGHANVAPLYTLATTSVVNAVEAVTQAAPVLAIDCGTTGISVEVQSAGSGGTVSVWTADVIIEGYWA